MSSFTLVDDHVGLLEEDVLDAGDYHEPMQNDLGEAGQYTTN
jgi:hypothetical protein